MSHEKTTLFNVQEIDAERTRVTLKEVYAALEERGYNPINQLIGYIMSGDPGYISSHKDARKRITNLERNKIVEVLLKDYMNNNK
jgi:uncharacterized protein (UPF0297 family)